jgi:hypothetical protein
LESVVTERGGVLSHEHHRFGCHAPTRVLEVRGEQVGKIQLGAGIDEEFVGGVDLLLAWEAGA